MKFKDLITSLDVNFTRPIENLLLADNPVVIYGTGVYAYVLFNYLRLKGIEVSKFVVDAKYLVVKHYLGLEVQTIEENVEKLASCSVVIGITNYLAAQEKLKAFGVNHSYVIDVPDFLNMPNEFMNKEFVENNITQFQEAYNLFEDDFSKQTFIAAINTKISGDLSFLLPVVKNEHLYFAQDLFDISDHEVLLDVGGFDGDSIRDFTSICNSQFDKIISLEPFDENFKKLTQTVKELGLINVVLINKGAWSESTTLSFSITEENIDNKITVEGQGTENISVDTLDNIIDECDIDKISLIKMDINGAEYEALRGAEHTLNTFRPNIAVKMHVKEDFYRLAILLKAMCPNIKLYLRQRNYMSMMLVLYATFE
ncbi:FkbM family methyltransferase [Thalassotalea sediminis]|uniref:FkbM family methyltransferase n=1 Tax=Thalassotalea sediminis TaxID=1759089 RepID=UPI00257479DF|nr:FkbM family methyltransferase [Thalassotalea sediminis]